MSVITKQLAPPGTTGNNTHTFGEDVDAYASCVQILVEAVGAGPTATFTWEGSQDGTNWYAIPYITPASATEAVTALVLTAVGASLLFTAAKPSRFFKRHRVRVTANTNVTYSILLAIEDRAD